MNKNEKIYLDYAASTPVDSRVVKAMQPYFSEIYGNPHALHSFGQEASRAVFEAKRKIGQAIGADYKELVFTGSATEANNLAIRGAIRGYKTNKSYRTNKTHGPRIIVSAFEHESILETCKDLEKEGVEVIYIPVNKDGFVDLAKLKAALNERTILVSIMLANNEAGTIQPIAEISKIIKAFRVQRLAFSKNPKTLTTIPYSLYPLLHTDAVQAFQYLDCDVNKLGVDLMTISAHKIYGPKGIGGLYIRPIGPISPIRPISPILTGTDNVPYIVGFAKAVELSMNLQNSESKRVGGLRDYFWKKLKKIKVIPRLRSGNKKPLAPELARPALAVVEGLQMNGSIKNRLPNNLNIYFPSQPAQELLIKLDLAGVAVSPGAACTTRTSKSSFVLEAMGFSVDRASESLRFSLGRQTTKTEIDRAVKILAAAVLSK